MSFFTDDNLLNIKSENATLLHTMQLHLNKAELESLNALLFKFSEDCLTKRSNPFLTQSLICLKKEFDHMR